MVIDNHIDNNDGESLFNMVLEKKLIKLRGSINGTDATMLVDSGASDNFISTAYIDNSNIQSTRSAKDNVVMLADGRQHVCNQVVKDALINVGAYSDKLDLRAIPLEKFDVVLGMPWLTKLNPTIDWKTRTVRVDVHKSNHDSYTVPANHSEPNSTLNFISSKQILRQKSDIANLYLVYINYDDINDNSTLVCNSIDSRDKNFTVDKLLKKYSDVFPEIYLPDFHLREPLIIK
jgi:hypothetical protein